MADCKKTLKCCLPRLIALLLLVTKFINVDWGNRGTPLSYRCSSSILHAEENEGNYYFIHINKIIIFLEFSNLTI